jgi:hypothetical protein
MSCDGGHLGFPIGIENRKFVEDLPMIIPGQFGFNCPRMAATPGLSLTLDPIGKMFQNASSLKPLGQLKPNCSGMIIGRSSTKYMFFEELPMIIPGQFGFNYPSGFREAV